MHRDIRWENVIKYHSDQDKWFIIDFDDACYISSVTSGAHLALDNHAPEIFEGKHDEHVDVWSVGRLILTSPVSFQEGDELKIYAKKMMAKNKVERPTAEEALDWLWTKHKKILIEDFSEQNMFLY